MNDFQFQYCTFLLMEENPYSSAIYRLPKSGRKSSPTIFWWSVDTVFWENVTTFSKKHLEDISNFLCKL